MIPTLNNISLKIKRNKLIAIVGQVGSGKSSLLSALLGDMIKTEGKVNVNGSIAYVPQQAWILNTTLIENVLFMKPMDRKRFDKVIECCALLPDLEILPGGELTEIGEKGINLSGGQKQRVAMARACYANADIYFLDDPISALDANVGKQVFEKVIGSDGILKNKTRILVTHRISLLPKVDEIVVMKDGSISEWGTYRELLDRKGDFAEFLVQYLENTDEALNDDEIEVFEEIVSKIRPELERTLSRTKNITSEESLRKRRLSTLSKSSLAESKADKSKDKSEKDMERGRGKLIDEETAQTGSVKWTVYVDYLKKVGFCSLLAVFLSDVLLSALNFGSSLWLSAWSDDSLDPQKRFDNSLSNQRLGVYGAFGGGQTIFTLISNIFITLACLQGAKILHNEMLVHMMRAPIFHFDTTPMGRILNRFSKDIDVADTVLGMSIRMVMMRFFSAIVSFSIIGYETPYVMLALIPLGIAYYFIQRYYISTSRQLRRIQSNARSPVIGHFSETLSGASSIRAYGMTKRFIDESNLRVDIHHNTTYESTVANRWLATRLEFLGYSIVLIDALFIVFTRESVSPGVAGLTLSYAMKITGTLNQLVTASTTLETDIVSVERCVEYTQTPTEVSLNNLNFFLLNSKLHFDYFLGRMVYRRNKTG
ncbi:MAG TPA: ABC transporter transmembrane domain-containing protein [Ignavibacteriaceae bacterium]